jgi:hypothetical protein
VTLLPNSLDAACSKRREERPARWRSTFSRGILYLILQNRLYREVAHKGNVYPGQHEAIVDAGSADRPGQLAANRRARSLGGRSRSPSLLSGLILMVMATA